MIAVNEQADNDRMPTPANQNEFDEIRDSDPVSDAINKLRDILNRTNSLNQHNQNETHTRSVLLYSLDVDELNEPNNVSDDILRDENKENEQPIQTPKPWYEGVVTKPVAFKATNRRSSQN